MVKVLSINSNGLGDPLKRKWIGDLSRKNGCDLVCIQETHLQSLDPNLIRDCWGGGDCDWEFVLSEGRSGGICSLWNP